MTSEIRARIFETAEQLLSEGKRPTQQLVRDRIGSGSLTTINSALNEWWATLSDRLQQGAKGRQLPEPVIRLSSRLWTETLAYARREYEALSAEEQKAYREIQAKLISERERYSAQLSELNQVITELRGALTSAEKAEDSARQTLLQTQDECYRLNQKLLEAERSKTEAGYTQHNSEELIEARVRLRIQQDQIDSLTSKNQELISKNAELKLKLSQQKS